MRGPRPRRRARAPSPVGSSAPSAMLMRHMMMDMGAPVDARKLATTLQRRRQGGRKAGRQISRTPVSEAPPFPHLSGGVLRQPRDRHRRVLVHDADRHDGRFHDVLSRELVADTERAQGENVRLRARYAPSGSFAGRVPSGDSRGPVSLQRSASWSRIWVRRTTSGLGGGGSAGAAFGVRIKVLIALMAANSATATIRKLITMVMKSP